MSVLALARLDELEARWQALGAAPSFTVLRRPEVGLVMVRGRAGGTGLRFNIGECAVIRCSVQLADGTLGHAWVSGRCPRHAELAAVLDALLQDARWHRTIESEVIGPLEASRESRRRAADARAAQTRVDFFTMVRGVD
jgi:alpha-D-ribose 1-methylphosphonate 5-triphosphate synthase subunit PhnG